MRREIKRGGKEGWKGGAKGVEEQLHNFKAKLLDLVLRFLRFTSNWERLPNLFLTTLFYF